jgi:hypothetical protein
MEEVHQKKIEEIMASMTCSKDFECQKEGFEHLRPAKDRGLKDYVDCLDEGGEPCEFKVPFGSGAFCRCPVRVYLVKKVGI